MRASSMKPQFEFLAFIVGAFFLAMIPVVHWPFSWLETYFHELSHGLAALVSGGRVDRIVLHLRGSGLSYTRGGWGPLVTFSGYVGAIVWGAVIYLGACAAGKTSRWMAVGIAALLVVTGLLWARDLITILIMLLICAAMYFSFRYVIGNVFPRLMEFAGVYIMVSAVRAPLNLIDGRHYGDGATLASITYIPEIIWVAIWFSLAIGMLIVVWKIHGHTVKDAAPLEPRTSA